MCGRGGGDLSGDSNQRRARPVRRQQRVAGAGNRRVKPQVVITFGPDGAYGHSDHIAISQLTTAAIVCAADPAFGSQPALRKLVSRVDGEERQAVPWPDWAITTVLDTSRVWPVVWRAVSCHKTQMTIYKQLEALSEEHQRSLWGTQEFYRVFSSVNGGRVQESDLFERLR
jgi:LmbE family N-acetylglucosaminyl deacetylase